MNTFNWPWLKPSTSTPSQPKTTVPLPDFLRFPTVEELVAQQCEDASRTPSVQSSGLFQALLQSHPEPLFEDATEHPDKYDEKVLPLLRDLISTRRSPTTTERQLLDAAMFDFSRTPAAPPAPPKPVQQAKQPRRQLETDVADEMPEQEFGIPKGSPQPFWWL